jgi:hypothetical protein
LCVLRVPLQQTILLDNELVSFSASNIDPHILLSLPSKFNCLTDNLLNAGFHQLLSLIIFFCFRMILPNHEVTFF